MTRKDIIKGLAERGIEAELTTQEKNGVKLDGIMINTNEKCRPVIYTGDLLTDANETGKTIDAILDTIEQTLSNTRLDFDPINLTSPDYIREHVKIKMQRATDEDIIKKPCQLDANIEIYLCLEIPQGDNLANIKLTPALTADMDIDTLWTSAELNTFCETDIFSLNEMLGVPGDGFMWIITNKARCKGASAILDRNALADFGKKHGCNQIFAIPSSLHEWIIIPYSDDYDIDMLSSMVKDVNGSIIDPVEQLGNHAYTIAI